MANKFSKGGGSGREKSEYDQKIIDIRRVTESHQRRKEFNFRRTIVAGNRRGRGGRGHGQGFRHGRSDRKSFRNARENLIKPKLTKDFSIPRETGSQVWKQCDYNQAGQRQRTCRRKLGQNGFDLAGIKDVNAKYLSRSKNKVNNAKVTIEALKKYAK